MVRFERIVEQVRPGSKPRAQRNHAGDGDQSQHRQLLEQRAANALAIARWMFHASRRLHPIVLDTANARTLMLGAALLLRARPGAETIPTRIAKTRNTCSPGEENAFDPTIFSATSVVNRT